MNNSLPHNLQQQVDAIYAQGTAHSTQRAYQRDLNAFFDWTKQHLNLDEHYPVQNNTLIAFILDKLNTVKVNTLRRYIASLSVAHQTRGYPSPGAAPNIKLLLQRATRAQQQPVNKKIALRLELLSQLLDACDDSLHGIRDKAILLTGFASGGRRRDELASLNVNDLTPTLDGYHLTLRHSKNDQTGQGRLLPVTGYAAQALNHWLEQAAITQGRLFRAIKKNSQLTDSLSGRSINKIVKRRAKLAGLNPDDFGAHSLRAGFITEADSQGVSIANIMALSCHQNTQVAQSYLQANHLNINPASHLLDKLKEKKEYK